MAVIAAAPLDHELAWNAVVNHDRSFDGSFVYAVRTTGVFCRPSCGSRRPRRENVSFFASPAEAEKAGYRPCARCRPAAPGMERMSLAVERAAAFLERHVDERVTLAALSRQVGVSPFHLQRAFSAALGVSPRAYQDSLRLARFKASVRGGEKLGMATFEAGYGSSRGLYESARAGMGMTPGTYRKGGAGERIAFTVAPSSLGRVLVAATSRGVCAVTLGDEDAALERGLRAEFPLAAVERDDAALAPQVEDVLRAAEGGAVRSSLGLDLRGTAFQLRVWRALRDIPLGETRSYRGLAKEIGRPTAARAVARACATNRVALVVPCHRVVREDGQLGGYRWGIKRKKRLLERESAAVAPSSRKGAAGP